MHIDSKNDTFISSRMLGFAGSAPTYPLHKLWLNEAKPNVYRRFSFFLPLIPNPSPARVEGRKHVVRLRFANRTYVAGDHISDAALSPLPLGEGQGEGNGVLQCTLRTIGYGATAPVYLPKRCNARRLLPPCITVR